MYVFVHKHPAIEVAELWLLRRFLFLIEVAVSLLQESAMPK